MLYSLVTLSHNKLACTRRCLTALLRDTRGDGPTELIAVDNGSTDGSREWLTEELPLLGAAHGVSVTTLTNAGNIGCATSRNQALARAAGAYIVFVDNDVAPRTRDWLAVLRRRIESSPTIGLAGPRLLFPHPPFAIQCAGVGISPRGHVAFLGRGEARDDARYAAARPVQCLISACLMVRGALLREHGGFDERFNPVQFEDFDLCYRLRDRGWEAWVEPAAELYHFESVTTQGTPSMPNPAVVVRNGLAFQRRWRALFENEEGPPESACHWRRLTLPPFATIGELPLR
jgi:GT2 family glycosyltransferase